MHPFGHCVQGQEENLTNINGQGMLVDDPWTW